MTFGQILVLTIAICLTMVECVGLMTRKNAGMERTAEDIVKQAFYTDKTVSITIDRDGINIVVLGDEEDATVSDRD